MRSTASQEILLSSAEVEIQATAGKPPSVSIVAYTGGLMTVPGWGPVAIDLAGLDAGAEQINNLSDFKTVTSYRLIGKDQYELLAPGGEIKHGTLGNETYSNRADTYGLMLSIDHRLLTIGSE
jgi:hypothetical protein